MQMKRLALTQSAATSLGPKWRTPCTHLRDYATPTVTMRNMQEIPQHLSSKAFLSQFDTGNKPHSTHNCFSDSDVQLYIAQRVPLAQLLSSTGMCICNV